jgi:hypothetical protein
LSWLAISSEQTQERTPEMTGYSHTLFRQRPILWKQGHPYRVEYRTPAALHY